MTTPAAEPSLKPIVWKCAKVIDAHAHYYCKEPPAHFYKLLEQSGYTKANIMSIHPRMNDGVLERKRERPAYFYIYGAMQHDRAALERGDGAGLVDQIDAVLARGFDGIKLLEGKPSWRKEHAPVSFDHAYWKPFWKRIADGNVPITVHTGDPVDMWSDESLKADYRDYLPQEEYFRQVIAVFERHPNLKINYAHFLYLSPQLERLDALLTRFPRLSIDLAPGSEFLYYLSDDPVRAKEFFLRWQDRILFGTDLGDQNSLKLGRAKIEVVRLFLESGEEFPNPTAVAMGRPPEAGSNGRTLIRGLELPVAVLEKILYRNYEAFATPEPKPLPKS